MLAVVKKRRTNKRLFEVKGNIPENVIDFLKDNYGSSFEVIDEDDMVDIFETEWFKKVNKSVTPGESLRIYRQNIGLNQSELGKRLGNYSKQHISDMEHSRRSISKETAKKLSVLFNIPVERFL